MGLSAFLAQNALKTENIKHVVSTRFLDEDGAPEQWEIRCVNSEEDEQIRKDCTKRIPVPGKRGQYTAETDYNAYTTKLAVACTVYPNLNDVELQNSYSVLGADKLLKVMLKPGELADYLIKVQEINGFSTPLEDEVEVAKN